MKDEHRVIRSLLEDYVSYMTSNEQNLGYPSRAVEQRMRDMGVKHQSVIPWDKEPWMSHKETIATSRSEPYFEFPRKSLSKINRIVYALPSDMKRKIFFKFDPLTKPPDAMAARFFGLKTRTFRAKMEKIYIEVSRKFKLMA